MNLDPRIPNNDQTIDHRHSSAFSATDSSGVPNVDLVPMDLVFRQANQFSTGNLMVAIGHTSLLLLLFPYLGYWTALLGLLLVAGIYHGHIRIQIRHSLGLKIPNPWAVVLWPWQFVVGVACSLIASLLGFALSAASVFFTFYLSLRVGFPHEAASEMAGWWGAFPSFSVACVCGTWSFWSAARRLLSPFP